MQAPIAVVGTSSAPAPLNLHPVTSRHFLLPQVDLAQDIVTYDENFLPQKSFRGAYAQSLRNCLAGLEHEIFQVAAGEVFFMWGAALYHALGPEWRQSIFDPRIREIIDSIDPSSPMRDFIQRRDSAYPEEFPRRSIMLHIGEVVSLVNPYLLRTVEALSMIKNGARGSL